MTRLAWARGAFELTKWFILAVLIIVIIHNFLMTVFLVSGPSMLPELKDQEAVVINRIVYSLTKPERGDIVVVRYPGDPSHTYYVKRIIGLPGEKVVINNGKVLINGLPLEETYINGQITAPEGQYDLPSDWYLTLGDNREVSSDSRVWGPVEKRFILGRVSLSLWPQYRAHPDPLY